MNELSLIYMTNLYEGSMDLNTKLQEEIENKENVINELLQRIALLERAIEEREKVIEEAKEYINNNIWHSLKDILEILDKVDKENK